MPVLPVLPVPVHSEVGVNSGGDGPGGHSCPWGPWGVRGS